MADDIQNTLLADPTAVAQLLRQADQAFGTTLLTTWQSGQLSDDQLLQLLPELQYSALARQLIDDHELSVAFRPQDVGSDVLAPNALGKNLSATAVFNLYNIQDRWRDGVFRAMTGADGQLSQWTASPWGLVNFRDESVAFDRYQGLSTDGARTKYAQRVNGWRYEGRSSILQSHFYATGAWLTLGSMMYGNKDINSSNATTRSDGWVALARQIVTTAVYTAGLFGTSVRQQEWVRRGQVTQLGLQDTGRTVDQELVDKAKAAVALRSQVSTAGLFVLALSNVVGLTFAAMKLQRVLDDDHSKPDYQANLVKAALDVTAQGLFLLTNTSKAMGGLTALLGTGKANYQLGGLKAKTWQIAGTAFGVTQSLVSVGSTAAAFAKHGLSAEEQAMVGAELALQVTSSALQAGSSYLLAARIASGGALAGPAIGAAVGGLMMGLSPIQIYGLVKQSQYADQLNELGQRMRDFGYGGDLLLSDMYDAKTEVDRNYLIATNVLATVGTVVSVLAASSVVGAPLAGVVSLATAIAGALLPLAQSAQLEEIARDYASKIDAAGGSMAFFGNSLKANYQVMLADPTMPGYLRQLQTSYGVDRVIAAATVPLGSTALELAALARRAVDLQTSTAMVDSYVNGQRQADGSVNIDPATGVMNLGGTAGSSQLLTFLTPLMSPGVEQRERVSTGKNGYYTGLQVVFGSSVLDNGRWTLNDGAANTVMDLRNVATRFVLKGVPYVSNGEISHDVELHVNGGDGDDMVIANAGSPIFFDGGAGHDAITYASMAGTGGGIEAYVDATGAFRVEKRATQSTVYVEDEKKADYTYGKRSETVEYRDVHTETRDIQQVDSLQHVEEITGTRFDDKILGDGPDGLVLHGGDGNDTLVGGDGDDVLDPGSGNNVVVGGNGQDTLDYLSLSGQSIRLDLTVVDHGGVNWTHVHKYDASGALAGEDLALLFQNVRGTDGADAIEGDANDNRFWGGEGNDTLVGDDGNDLLSGGNGINVLDGGLGTDLASYADDAVGTQDYGVWVSTQAVNTSRIASSSLVALPSGPIGLRDWRSGGTAVYSDRGQYDLLTSIENVVGSAGRDYIEGGDENNQFAGGTGNDMLVGHGGDDLLVGGGGVDVLDGGDGNDTADLSDSAGHLGWVDVGVWLDMTAAPVAIPSNGDYYNTRGTVYQAAWLWGFPDSLTLSSQAGAYLAEVENVIGTRLSDVIIGDAQDNRLSGGSGDDLLRGGTGNDVLDGGDGWDTVYGDAGDDSVAVDIDRMNVYGDLVYGGDGFDILELHSASFGTWADLQNQTAWGYDGLSWVGLGHVHIEGIEALVGTETADVLLADAADNVIAGMGGNDRLEGRAGDDVLSGNDGNDTLIGGDGTDFLSGGDGLDSLQGGAGDDLLRSGAGNDTLDGGDGNDTADYFDHAAGADNGVKVLLYSGIAYESRNENAAYDTTRYDTLASIENVRGTVNSDALYGDAQDNQLFAEAGNDRLFGQDGNDQLNGGAGNDWVNGQNGNDWVLQTVTNDDDTLDGGDGIDTVDYRDVVAPLRIDLGLGRADKTLNGVVHSDLLSGFENAIGGLYGDLITGDAGANGLVGMEGKDTLAGGDGDDVLLGNDDDDLLQGGNGKDELIGGNGADSMLGGAGDDVVRQEIDNFNDTLDGGDGNDAVDYSLTDLTGGSGIVADLLAGTVQKLGANATPSVDTLRSVETLVATDVADAVRGGDADEALDGRAGDDVVMGRGGNDTLSGGLGSDLVFGDSGDDLVLQNIEAVSDVLMGGAGHDWLHYGVTRFDTGTRDDNGTGTLMGIDADLAAGRVEKFRGGPVSHADTAIGFESLTATLLNDRVLGSARANAVDGVWGDDWLDGRAGNDTLSGSLGNDTLLGDDGDDLLSGGGGSDSLDGGAGNDRFEQDLERGNDTLVGGAGIDTLDYSGTALVDGLRADGMGDIGVMVMLGQGDCSVRKYASQDADGTGRDQVTGIENVIGTGVNDTIMGDDGANWLRGVEGNDWLSGLYGDDTLDGGAGNDNLSGYVGNDLLSGGRGNDTLIGGTGNDTYEFAIGDGHDTIDESNMGGGDDTLQLFASPVGASAAAAMLWLRRDGNDVVISVINAPGDEVRLRNWYSSTDYRVERIVSSDGWVLKADSVDPLVQAMATMTMPTDPNAVSLTVMNTRGIAWTRPDGERRLLGGAYSELLEGGNGNDEFEGGAGNDTLFGFGGDDVFHQSVDFGDGDVIDGGYGNNSITFDETVHPSGARGDGSTQGVQVNLGSGTAIKRAGAAVESIIGINNATGCDLDDSLTGSTGANALQGLDGDDLLAGVAGNDSLSGGTGMDTLDGGDGQDLLAGGEGDDLLKGGNGGDIYIHVRGDGNDRIEDSGSGAGNLDILAFTADEDGEGIDAEKLWFSRVGDDLQIDVIDGADRVTVAGWFTGAQRPLGQFVDSSGRTLLASGVDALLATMSGPMPASTDSLATGTLAAINTAWQLRNTAPQGSVSFSGTLRAGSTLSATHNLADFDGLGTVGWQWQWADPGSTQWNDLVGATAASWLVDDRAGGRLVRVLASYTDGRGTVEQVASAASSTTVLGSAGNHKHTGHVVVASSQAVTGIALRAWFDIVDPDGPLQNVSYQWQLSSDGQAWSNASNGNGLYFTPTAAQAGQMVRVALTYLDPAGWTETEVSGAFGPLATGGSSNAGGSVGLSGTPQLGSQLSASVSASDPDGIVGAPRLVWQTWDSGAASWVVLAGQTASTLALDTTLVGRTVRAVASFVDTLGKWSWLGSASTKVLPSGSVTWSANGSLGLGATLTVANSIADASVSYRWQSSADGQGGWSDISGANGSSYMLQQAEVGRYMRVVAVYADALGGQTLVTAPASTSAVAPGMLFNGDSGNDLLVGGIGADTLLGAAGDDTLRGGAGNDSLDGGAGADTADFSDAVLGDGNGIQALMGSGIVNTGRYANGVNTTGLQDSITGIENLIGSRNADVMYGTGAANRLDGNDGNDLLLGYGGDDTLVSGAGCDNLDGGTGTDLADYSGQAEAVNVNLAAGTASKGASGSDTLANMENLAGSAFNDTLAGDANANLLSGGAGNDTLVGGAGNDTLAGGTGVDLADYSGQAQAVNVNLGTGSAGKAAGGSDTLVSVENVLASAYNDTLAGDASANLLSGGAGNDSLVGSAGNDTLDGGAGSDGVDYAAQSQGVSVTLNAGAATVAKANGTDILVGIENLTGSAFNDSLAGDAGPNLLAGGAGDDTLRGGADNDTLDGGAGTDTADFSDAALGDGKGIQALMYSGIVNTGRFANGANTAGLQDSIAGIENIVGTRNADALWGNANANRLEGGDGNDLVFGDYGDDTLLGGTGSDSVSGSFGNDTLQGGAGNDTLDGGEGLDTADFSDAVLGDGNGIQALMYSGIVNTGRFANGTNTAGLQDSITGIENIVGTRNADALWGDANANRLEGGDGNDLVFGDSGDDTLLGGAGSDSVSGSVGNDLIRQDVEQVNDTLDGGTGSDTVDYGLTAFGATRSINGVATSEGVTADLTAGLTWKFGTANAGIDTLVGIENIIGTSLDDTLRGNGTANTLQGGAGNDRLQDGASLARGRYLRIYHGDATTILSFTELQVWVAGVNLALGKPVLAGSDNNAATTTYHNALAMTDGLGLGAAWNGASGSNCNLGWVAANNSGDKAWLQIDLGAVVDIERIVAIGRSDNPAANLKEQQNLRFVLSDAPISGNYAALAGSTSVTRIDSAGASTAGTPLTLDPASAPVADVFDGGGGTDTLDYGSSWGAQRAALGKGVNVDLAAGTADKWWNGASGTGSGIVDTLAGIENVTGTAQADNFKGDANGNVFRGGAGADTYTMRSGFGQDTIVESGTDSDVVVFDAASSQLWFRHVGNDLVINALGTGDALTVKDWYAGSGNQVETLRAGDGKALLNSQVDALVNAMAGYSLPSAGPVSTLPNYASNLAPAMAGWD